MNIKEEIFLNQISRNIRSIDDGVNWFKSLEADQQLEVLRQISYMANQARANENDVDEAILSSKLKNTFTPCVLLKKGRLNIQLSKILNLPSSEYLKIFLLLINLFRISDERRRKLVCKGCCAHWWHKDLSDEKIVKEILDSNS